MSSVAPSSPSPQQNPVTPRRRRCWCWLALIVAGALVTWGCGRHGAKEVHPQPKAARAPVTPGELIQLRLAVEGFDTIFDARAEEQDLLPALTHAWATFYHWPDPAPNQAARYAFTDQLCRARVDSLGEKRDLFDCIERLRAALLDDLISVTEAYIRAGHPDKIGPYRLRRLLKEFRLRRDQFRVTRKLRLDRRKARILTTVDRCELEQPLSPVVGLQPAGITLNGFPILSPPPKAAGLQEMDLDGFRRQLEDRLSERPSVRRAAQQVILAVDRRARSLTLSRLLSAIAGLGVTRLCLKVTRRGEFTVPCCLVVRVTPRLVALNRSVVLEKSGAFLVRGRERARLPDDPHAWPKARVGLTEPGGNAVAVQLRAGVSAQRLVTWLSRLQAPGEPPEIVLNPTFEPRINVPRPATPPGTP